MILLLILKWIGIILLALLLFLFACLLYLVIFPMHIRASGEGDSRDKSLDLRLSVRGFLYFLGLDLVRAHTGQSSLGAAHSLSEAQGRQTKRARGTKSCGNKFREKRSGGLRRQEEITGREKRSDGFRRQEGITGREKA